MCAYPSRHYTAHTAPHPRQELAAPRGPDRLSRSRVTKTLQPGQPGTARWQHVYGEHLVCVRYREDLQANARYVTVELVLESRPLLRQPPPAVIQPHPAQPRTPTQRDVVPDDPRPNPPDAWQCDVLPREDNTSLDPPRRTPLRPSERVGVRIGLDESALQKQARQHGAEWNRDLRLWLMTRETAEQLGWEARIMTL